MYIIEIMYTSTHIVVCKYLGTNPYRLNKSDMEEKKSQLMEERHVDYQIKNVYKQNLWPKRKLANGTHLKKVSSDSEKRGSEWQLKLTNGNRLELQFIRLEEGKIDDDTDSDYRSDRSCPVSRTQPTMGEKVRFLEPDVFIRTDNPGYDIHVEDSNCNAWKRKNRSDESVSSSSSWKIGDGQSAPRAIAYYAKERAYSEFHGRNTDCNHEDASPSNRFPRIHSRSAKYPSPSSFYAYMQKLREKMEDENQDNITDDRAWQVEAPKASSKEIRREKDPEFFTRQKRSTKVITRGVGPDKAQVDQYEKKITCSNGVTRTGRNDLTTVSPVADRDLTWRDWKLQSSESNHNRHSDLGTMRPNISQVKRQMSDIRNPTEADYEPSVIGDDDDEDDYDYDHELINDDGIFDCLDSIGNSEEKEESPAVEAEVASVTNSAEGVTTESTDQVVGSVDENQNLLDKKLPEQRTAMPSRSLLDTKTTTSPALKWSPIKPPRADLRGARPRWTARSVFKRTPPLKPERQSLSKLSRVETNCTQPEQAVLSQVRGVSRGGATVTHIRVDKWHEDWSPPRKYYIQSSLSDELLDKIEREMQERRDKRKKLEDLRREFSLTRLSNEIKDISHEIDDIMGPQRIERESGEKNIYETPKRVYRPDLSLEKHREIDRSSQKHFFSTAATGTAEQVKEDEEVTCGPKTEDNRARTAMNNVDSEPVTAPPSPKINNNNNNNNNEKMGFSRVCSFNRSGSRAMSFIRNIPRLMSNRRRPNMESTWNNSKKRPAEFAASESVVDISTLTIQTQSPVSSASPEKSPPHERSIWRLSNLTPAAKSKGRTKTPATDRPKGSNKLSRRMSLCRSWTLKFRKKCRTSILNVDQPEPNTIDPNDLSPDLSAAVKELLRCADIELTRMYQASKALELCFSMPEFVGGPERVESERQLLVSGLRRKAFHEEISAMASKLDSDDSLDCDRAHLVIGDLSLRLRHSIARLGQDVDQAEWYVVVAAHGHKLWVSQAVECPRAGPRLYFPGIAEFSQLLPDFKISLSVYKLRLRMTAIDHASKYHLPAKEKNPDRTISCPSPSDLLFRSEKRRSVASPKHADFGATGMRESSFLPCGKLELQLADLSKSTPWTLSGIFPGNSVLHGTMDMTTRCKIHMQVEQSGFVNHGEELGSSTNWNRRWAVLDGRYLRFWNYPDEQHNNSHPLKEIDLADCMSESIGPIDRSLCARARTLLVEIARTRHNVDKDRLFLRSPNDQGLARNLLSFDTPCELTEWQSKLNHVVSTLRAWNVKKIP